MVFRSNLELPEFLTSFFKGRGNYLRKKAKHFWNGLIPLPIKLTHIFTEAIELQGSIEDIKSKTFVKETLENLQQECQNRLDALLEEKQKEKNDIIDISASAFQSFIHKMGF